jgi:hypothetical protein
LLEAASSTLKTRLRLALFLLPLVCAPASAALKGADEPSVRPVRMVLQQRDVGTAYLKNTRFSRPRTLTDGGSGDSPPIRRRLREVWVGGYQTGFNGRSVPWGIVSTVDVFRGSSLTDIERAWRTDALRATGGRMLLAPPRAPGSFRLLIRGRVTIGSQPAQIDLYMWQTGRAIASVDVTGRPGSFPASLILTLARRQDIKIRSALR